MVKFLKPNKAVVVLNGTGDRPYGHCLVGGISKYPKLVILKDSAKKTTKRSRVKAFIKLVNQGRPREVGGQLGTCASKNFGP
ncbi:putative ribosomal protein L27e [Helianthus anomalus]